MAARRSHVPFVLGALGAVLLAGGVAGWLYFHPRPPAAVPTPVTPAPLPPPVAAEPALPDRAATDAQVRRLFGHLSRQAAWRAWLRQDDLVTRILAIADGLARGVVPRDELGAFAPRRPFAALVRRGHLVIDPRSFHRYDAFADLVSSLDAHRCVAAYQTLLPILRIAYHVFGYPKADFDVTVHRALATIEETPVPAGTPRLQDAEGALYRFADPKLEGLDAVQKQILRMGSGNQLRIQDKARELDALLRGPNG